MFPWQYHHRLTIVTLAGADRLPVWSTAMTAKTFAPACGCVIQGVIHRDIIYNRRLWNLFVD
jgi:hypothetical protein